tara:strand:+ start:2134 stop:2433 length:300 start_codon:yes stop_codon:yes gene_type:complete
MASINTISIDLTKIDKSKIEKEKYLNIVVTLNDETNKYGQNVNVTHSQTKEERDLKTPKIYIGNGRTVWNDGNIVNAEKIDNVNNAEQNEDREDNDLIF